MVLDASTPLHPLPDGSGRAFRASRLARFVANLIDWIVLVVPVLIAMYVVYALAFHSGRGLIRVLGPLAIFGTLFGILGGNAWLLVESGQTFGKRVMKLEIVSLEGTRVDFYRAVFLREIVPSVVYCVPLVGVLGYFVDRLMIFGHERRCMRDHLAGTVVVSRSRIVSDAADVEVRSSMSSESPPSTSDV